MNKEEMNPQQMSNVAPVTAEVRVVASPERAFDLFTKRITDWWPVSYALVPLPREINIEPRKNGAWFEKGADGSTRLVATVTLWAPPDCVSFNWHIDASWQTDPHLATEVNVTFVELANGTVVTLKHGQLGRLGEQADSLRQSLDGPGGWQDILAGFAELASATG